MKEFISSGKLKELGLKVFGQKLDANSESSYTNVLTSEEECLIVREMLEERNRSGWFNFLCRYQKHYPLSNAAVDLLIANILHSDKAHKLVTQEFKFYSFNEGHGLAICKAADALGADFLYNFCICGRILFQSVYQKLLLISLEDYPELCKKYKLSKDKSFGDIYKETIQARRKS